MTFCRRKPKTNRAWEKKDLDPIISMQMLHVHHTKIHGAHVSMANKLLPLLAEFANQVEEGRIDPSARTSDEGAASLRKHLMYFLGGHVNHSMFWENLAPYSSGKTSEAAAPVLTTELRRRWGSVAAFRRAFQNCVQEGAPELKGNGWAWLVWSCDDEQLDIKLMQGEGILPRRYKPLLAIDVWEHAYFLQYTDDKRDYLDSIWSVVNWEVMEKRFAQTVEETYGNLLLWCRLEWLGLEMQT